MSDLKRRRTNSVVNFKSEVLSNSSITESTNGSSQSHFGSSSGSGEGDENGFKPGYIIHVKVWNFTTYTYGEFNLSPTLNMIIGPNGTGKSTLVSAICLGLGGRIDLIKRKNLKSMIKSGFNESTIQITLKGKEPNVNHLIERKFTERESKWKVNNRKSDEKSVRKLVQSFNIQLDNLCHFLPQERVAEFAGLSPEKLLLETERTIGGGNSLLSMHEDLIRNDNEREQLKLKLTTQESQYKDLLESRDRLQEDAQKYQDYQAKTKDLENHIKLIPYAQIQDLKLEQKHLKKERDRAKKALEKFSLDSKPIDEQLTEFKKSDKQAREEMEAIGAEKVEASKQLASLVNLTTTHREKIKELKHSIGLLKTRSARKLQELENFKKERDELKLKIEAEFPEATASTLDDEDHINSLKESRDSIHDELSDVKSQIEELEYMLRPKKLQFEKYKQQKQELEQRLTSNDKLDVIRRNVASNRNAQSHDLIINSLEAHKLLRKQYPTLQGKYFECPVVSCEIKDNRYAKYIEKIIDNNTLWGFSFDKRQNYDEINNIVFKKYNVPMRVTSAPALRSRIRPESLKDFGFDGYLSDFISGPPQVLNMLNEVSNLNNIPVSLKPLSEQQLNKLLEDEDGQGGYFKKFLSGDSLFTIGKSKYGNRQLFSYHEKVWPASFFHSDSSTVTEHTKQQIEGEIQAINRSLQGILAEVETHTDKLRERKALSREVADRLDGTTNQIEEILKLKNLKNTLIQRLESKNAQIKKVESESKRDLTDKIHQVEAKIKQKFQQISEVELEISKLASKISDLSIKFCHSQFFSLEWENKVITATHVLGSLDEYKEQLKQNFLEAKAKYDEIKKSDAAKKIQEQSASYTAEERVVLGTLAAQYVDSNTLTEIIIRNKIKLIEEERSLMSTADQSSMELLRRKLQEIEFAEREIPILRSKLQQLNERIDTIQKVWEPQLVELVLKISQTFRERFTSVASDGQVEIGKADRFKDWKLQILVKFRENSELKILDHQSQSGGERAVSTIFFIMSLQGLTDAPFRVVDEINQGMDPKNEKMAHRYLVHTACTGNSSQYFLVTPKLLTGLYYHPSMTIHCIYTDTKKEGTESKPVGFLDFAKRKSIRV